MDSIDGIDNYSVRRDNRWLATAEAASYDDVDLAAGEYTYQLRYRLGGETITVPCSPDSVTVAAAPAPVLTCTVNARGVVRWNAIDGVSEYQIRKNGSWLASSSGQISGHGGSEEDEEADETNTPIPEPGPGENGGINPGGMYTDDADPYGIDYEVNTNINDTAINASGNNVTVENVNQQGNADGDVTQNNDSIDIDAEIETPVFDEPADVAVVEGLPISADVDPGVSDREIEGLE